jgi:hypothetical protein
VFSCCVYDELCSAIAIPNSLEIDHYMWAIIRELSASNVDQVYIDSMGNWRPFIAGESQFIRPGTYKLLGVCFSQR